MRVIPFRVAVAVGLISAAVLAQQVLLTRMLSAVLFYHFTFLAISLALLGTGVGGVLVFVRPHWFDRRPLTSTLGLWSLAFGIVLVVSPTVLVRLDYTYNNSITAGFAVGFILACLISLVAFAAAGIAIALVIRGYAPVVGKVYAFDLVGAGVGAALVVPLMWVVSAPTGTVVLGVAGGVAAGLFAWPSVPIRRVALGVVVLGVVGTVLSTSTGLNYLPSPYFVGVKPLGDQWTPLDRVLSYAPPHPKRSPFGFLFYDRVYAPIPIHHRGTPYPNWKALQTVPESIGLTVAHHGNVLVIGGGGGRDIYDALSSGFRHVDVIELNTAIVDMIDTTDGSFSGSPYTAPGVHTVVGDGRSILASRSTRYNEIHIGFTDTLSGSSADAFALTENNLYTVQAFNEYYDHLKPGGILSVTRQYRLVGDEGLRATVLTLQTLEDRGIRDPGRNVVVLTGYDQFGAVACTVLSQLTPFTPAELSEIRTLAAQRKASVVSMPGGPYRLQWAQLHKATNLGAFCTTYKFNVCPSTDDNPFFFNMTRLSGVFQTLPKSYLYTIQPFTLLTFTVGVLLVLSLIGFSVPLAMMDPRSRPPTRRLVYFAAIGVGFLTLEVTLIQRFVLFLGFPTYALTVVLCSLLVFTGIGAWWSSRWRDPGRALAIDLGVLIALMGVSSYLLQPLLGDWIGLPFVARVLISLVMLAPFGVCMGMVMPIGLRRLTDDYDGALPWAWSVNGFASVFGAAAGIFVAIEWGYAVATLVALGCYVVVAAEVVATRWGRAPGARPQRPAVAERTRSGVPV